MELTIKQTEALDFLEDATTREILYGGGAGGGKSVLGCYWVLKCLFKYPESRYLVARSRLTTLRQTTLNTLRYVARMQDIPADAFSYNESRGEILLRPTSSVIVLKPLQSRPSDPDFDELGSLEVTGAFIDECNQISLKAWNIVRSRIRYRLNDYNLIPKILGTCNPSRGYVYNRFYKPWKEGVLDEDKRFISSLVGDNPYISSHYKDSLKGLDSRSRDRLLYGSWEYDEDPSALMNYDKIIDMFSPREVKKDERYITADIARFGSDSTVICLWYGLMCESIKVIPRSGVDETSAIIRDMCAIHGVLLSHVICDEDGVGGGVVDTLRCKGFVNNSSPIMVRGKQQNFSNLKNQCYFLWADYVNRSMIRINVDDVRLKDRIIEEMQEIKAADITVAQRLSIVSKREMKENLGRSPDVADALMMRMYFELKDVGEKKTLEIFF